jgi:hypothetical protein
MGLGPRHIAQWVPRDLSALTSTLDRLRLDHVYTDYWLAYRLDFDTRERIIAVENTFSDVTFGRGQAVPSSVGAVRRPAYERAVERARHGFVFYRETLASVPIVRRLEQLGYRKHLVGSYAVYAPPG